MNNPYQRRQSNPYNHPSQRRNDRDPQHQQQQQQQQDLAADRPANDEEEDAASSSSRMIGDAALLESMQANSVAATATAARTANSSRNNATPGTNATTSMSKEMQEPPPPPPDVIKAQMEALQEANFELQATLATMQAEQAYSLQGFQKEAQLKISNLQNKLRLEQQTTQRLLALQQQQQQSSSSSSKRLRVDSAAGQQQQHAQVFENRLRATPRNHKELAAASPGFPQEIHTTTTTTTTAHEKGTTTTRTAPMDVTPPSMMMQVDDPEEVMEHNHHDSINPTTTTTTHIRDEGGVWNLVKHLLFHVSAPRSITSSSSSTTDTQRTPTTTTPCQKIHTFLVQLLATSTATTSTTSSTLSHHPHWSEGQLVEYLLSQVATEDDDDIDQNNDDDVTTQTKNKKNNQDMLVYWESALQFSRIGRRGILTAMKTMERLDEERERREANDNDNTVMMDTTTNTTTTTTITRRLKPRIHTLNPDGSKGAALQRPEPNDYSMNHQVVQHWIQQAILTNLHQPRQLRLLALILQDGSPSYHSTSLWWNILLPGLTEQLISLHAQYTQPLEEEWDYMRRNNPKNATPRGGSRKTTTGRGGGGSNTTSILKGRGKFQWTDHRLNKARRYRFQSPVVRERMQDQVREDLLLAVLTLMDVLLHRTKLQVLETTWFDTIEKAPRQPYLIPHEGNEEDDGTSESAQLWVGLLLDITESLKSFQNPKLPLVLPIWYPSLISLLSTIGQTVSGMKVLRSRLPDVTGGEQQGCRPNAIDISIVQLFQLSLMTHGEELEYMDEKRKYRLYVMGGWIRFLHQVLLFVQDSEYGISFRSLVIDTHDYYTSACTRVLTDAYISEDLATLIRLQLDELAMDQEEHDDLKYK